MSNENNAYGSLKTFNKLKVTQIAVVSNDINIYEKIISQNQTLSNIGSSEKGEIIWSNNVSFGNYGYIGLNVTVDCNQDENPIYGINPGSNVNIITSVDSGSTKLILGLKALNLESTLSLNNAIGNHSLSIPDGSLNINIGLKELINFIFPNSTVISKKLTLDPTNPQSESIKIPNTFTKGDMILVQSQFILFISDFSLNINLLTSSLNIRPIQLNNEWISNNIFQIGIEIEKTKPLPGFELIFEILILTLFGSKILYNRKLKK